MLGTWKWLNALLDLVGGRVTCSYLARTTCLVFNFVSAFIFLLVLGMDNVVWKNLYSLLVLCVGMLFFLLNLLLLLYLRPSL